MKDGVKKHKNKSCWAKGETTATGSAYSKAKAAVSLHKFKSQRALDDLETMNALQCKLHKRAGNCCRHTRAGPPAQTLTWRAGELLLE